MLDVLNIHPYVDMFKRFPFIARLVRMRLPQPIAQAIKDVHINESLTLEWVKR